MLLPPERFYSDDDDDHDDVEQILCVASDSFLLVLKASVKLIEKMLEEPISNSVELVST